jgi:Na+/H+ antiporter NhaA
MSLFVANLAFPGQANHLTASKVGMLTASLISGVVGGVIIARSAASARKA